jgi:hypothetical protein
VNEKRKEFIKKSREQTRLRYKYYTYVRGCGRSNNSLRQKPPNNPEMTLTTLAFH